MIHSRSGNRLNDGQSKRKVKQFAAGRLTRNSSHTKLPRIKSSESFFGPAEKARLARSRSSGDFTKLRSRSGSRISSLTGLSSLNGNRSYPNLPGKVPSLRGNRHKVVIDLVEEDDTSDSDEAAEEVDSFDAPTKQKLDAKKSEKANKGKPDGEEVKDHNNNMDRHNNINHHKLSTKDEPSYDANYVLSQSTGQERQIGRDGRDVEASNTSLRNRYDDMSSDGASLCGKSSSSNSLVFRQSGLNLAATARNFPPMLKRGLTGGSSSLGRQFRGGSITPVRSPRKQLPTSNRNEDNNNNNTDNAGDGHNDDDDNDNDSFTNNFNSYLTTQQPKLETRTQQKLWLQRENISSLVDIADSNNAFVNNITRMEYERLSREFLNIRRFTNPMLKSLTAVKKIPGLTIQKRSTSQLSKGSDKQISEESHFKGKMAQYNTRINAYWHKNLNKFYSGKPSDESTRQEADVPQHNTTGVTGKRPALDSYYSANYLSGVPFNRLPQQLKPTTRAQQKVSENSSVNLVNLHSQ